MSSACGVRKCGDCSIDYSVFAAGLARIAGIRLVAALAGAVVVLSSLSLITLLLAGVAAGAAVFARMVALVGLIAVGRLLMAVVGRIAWLFAVAGLLVG